MARVTGIVIDITGKTSGLVSSLKDADAALSKTNSALKAVNDALKLDGAAGNIDLLKSKEELLTKAVADTNTKLQVLRETASQAMATVGQEGGATTEQVAQLQAEIAKTEKTLADLESEARATGEQLEAAFEAQSAEQLETAIADTEKELESLKEQAAAAMQTLGTEGGASAEQVAELERQISETETTLDGLRAQAADTGEELDDMTSDDTVNELADLGEESESTGADLSTLEGTAAAAASTFAAFAPAIGAVTAAVGILAAGVKAVIDALKKTAEVCIEAAKALTEKFAKAAKEIADELETVLKKLTGFTQAGGDYADTVNTMSKTTGIATDTLQEYMYAAELIDVSVETLTGAMAKNQKAMASAASGSKATAETYEKLGIAVTDANGEFRDSQTVFFEVIDALGKIENETERNTTAQTLLGKSCRELNPLILAGSDTLKKYGEEAHKAGAVLSSDMLNAFQAFDDNMVRLEQGAQAAERGLGMILLPLLTSLSSDGVNLLGQFTNGVVEAQGDIEKIGQVISDTLPGVLQSIIDNLPAAVEIINKLVKTSLQTVIDNLPAILSAIHSVAVTIGETLLSKENLSQILDAITEIIKTILDFFAEHGEELVQIGVTVIISLIEGLARALPQLIPALTNAVITIIDTLTKPENLEAFINAMVALIEAFAEGINVALPRLLEHIGPLIEAICNAIVVLAPLILDAGLQIFTELLTNESLQNCIKELTPKIVQLIEIISVKLWEAGQEIIPEAFKTIFSSMQGAAQQWGADIIKGLIEGISSMYYQLQKKVEDVASMIADFLGFSEPEKGPLSDFHTFAPDMIDLWNETMIASLPKLESGLNVMAGTIADTTENMGPNYTGALSEINGSINALGSGSREVNITTPVYIGTDMLGVAVAKANYENAYLTGGR